MSCVLCLANNSLNIRCHIARWWSRCVFIYGVPSFGAGVPVFQSSCVWPGSESRHSPCIGTCPSGPTDGSRPGFWGSYSKFLANNFLNIRCHIARWWSRCVYIFGVPSFGAGVPVIQSSCVKLN